ncbi:DUF2971 domain-containing protein [Dongia sp.]|uniref:DUF2971 domain-containing protein n=1 Tax=Dongia sp. TaxID=1977262 RepID=UPI0035AF6D13
MAVSKKVPQRLYKYRAFNNLTLDLLVVDHTFFADPSTFNDPLDTQPHLEVDIENVDLKEVLSKMVSERERSEMNAAAHAINYSGPKTVNHISKLSRRSAARVISEIEYFATDIEHAAEEQERLKQLLRSSIEVELRRRYNKGVLSLAERPNCPLMWSHYGDQHKGICIGYSVPPEDVDNLIKVDYRGGRRVKVSDIAAMLSGDKSARQIVDRAVLARKAPEWKYEREWRLIGDRGLSNSALELEEVIFGLKCESPMQYVVIKALERRRPKVRFYEICETRGSFSLKKRPLDMGEMLAHYPRRYRDILDEFTPV